MDSKRNDQVSFSRKTGTGSKKWFFLFLIALVSSGFADDFLISPNPGQRASVAWNGSYWLVVWENTSGYYDIYGQVVSAAGELVDTNFAIAEVVNPQFRPHVATNGQNMLVVWRDERHEFCYPDVYGQLISLDGELIDTNFPVSPLPDTSLGSDVASDGTDYLVVWDGGRYGWRVHGQLISSSGELIDSAFAISEDLGALGPARVAWSGTNYLVVWEDGVSGVFYGISGQLVSSDGELIDSAFRISEITNPQLFPDVASNGENFLVVWNSNGQDIVYGQLVSLDGELIDTNVTISERFGSQKYPRAASDGRNYVVVWCDNYHIWSQYINSTGAFIDTNFTISATDRAYSPDAAWSGEEFLVVWEYSGIWGRLVSSVGVEEERLELSDDHSIRLSPNPFFGSVEISGCNDYEIYDLLGRKIRRLRGNVWDGRDDQGNELPYGTYYIKPRGEDRVLKVIKLRR